MYGQRYSGIQHSTEVNFDQLVDQEIPGDDKLETVTATPSGGYEHEFTDKFPDKYKCMICHKVQREATITSCCCKHYCKTCIEEWFRKQGVSCPHCRSRSFNHFVNRQQVQDINELRVYCSNHKAGCKWEGKLEDLKSHVDSNCDYSTVNCPNKCHEEMLRKDLKNHKQNDCFLRAYTCQHCGHKDTYHTITGECGKYGHCDRHKGHYKRCQDFPLECPNECEEEKAIKRKDMGNHLEECPLQPVDCPFQEVGCTTHVVRKDLQGHIDSSDHHHLMLMMTAFKEIKKENAQLKEENRNIRIEIKKNTSRIPAFESHILTETPTSMYAIGSSKKPAKRSHKCCFY